jgi:lysine-specific permease
VLNDGQGHAAPFIGGIQGVIFAFLAAGFSFQGTELIGLTAGESENPSVNVPKAIKTVFWRILIFYLGAIIIVAFLIPFTNPNLLKTGVEDIAYSPFTMVFAKLGIAGAASILNAVILTSVLSAGNSGLYACTRMLYAMAKEGKAPEFFGKVNKRGVPINAIIITTIVSAACFLTGIYAEDTVYVWLVAASGLAGFVTWVGIALCHYRFRKAYFAQGKKLSDLKFTARLFPLGPVVAFVLCIIVILGQGTTYFMAGNIDWIGVISSYIGLPMFFALWLGFKIKYKTKVIDLMDVDLKNT